MTYTPVLPVSCYLRPVPRYLRLYWEPHGTIQ